MFPSYQNQDWISAWTAITQELKKNLGIEAELLNTEIGIFGQHYGSAYNHEPEYFGLTMAASGKSWKDITIPWDWGLQQFADGKTQLAYAKFIEDRDKLSKGAIKIPGGSADDFDKIVAQVKAEQQKALAVFANGAHSDELKSDLDKTFKGWVDQATKFAADGKAGKDTDKNWTNVNDVLLRAQAASFQFVNRTKDAWDYDEWKIAALKSTNASEQAAYAKKAQDLVLSQAWNIPLWVQKAASLVKPYVKGLDFYPFWWGQEGYLKRVTLEK
jgi:hypothetical protein